MNGDAWAMMVLVCGFVWGGFCLLLIRAFGSERSKGERGEPKGH